MSRLPESLDARGSYLEIRDHQSRWRTLELQRVKGDLSGLRVFVLNFLAYDAEVSHLREGVDFAESEGMLTPEMIEAADAAIAWGMRLRELVMQVKDVKG